MQVYSRFRCISGLSPKQVASVIFQQFLREKEVPERYGKGTPILPPGVAIVILRNSDETEERH